MSEATLHVTPSDTTLIEEAHNLVDDTRSFLHRNGEVLGILLAMGVCLLINRSMMRRELRRLSFNVEVFPFDQFDPDDYAGYLNE